MATKASNRQLIYIKTAFSKQIISLQQMRVLAKDLNNPHQMYKYQKYKKLHNVPNLSYHGNKTIELSSILHKTAFSKPVISLQQRSI